MGLRINTNVASLNAQNKLAKTNEKIKTSSEKLASGERINKSADDAAGLAVSENLRSDIRSLNMARRNANDGVSLIETAEGGLSETNNMLVRMRELAIQSASDTVGNKERGFIDNEFVQLKDEIDRIAGSTEFNGTRLLVGENQIGADMESGANPFPLEVQVGKDYFINSDSLEENNPVNIIRIDFAKVNGFTEGEGSLDIGRHKEGTRVDSKVGAQRSVSRLDGALMKVNEHRAYLGAIQNRLGSSMSNLETQVETLSAANSRIRDTDFAQESANNAKLNILSQAGTSVLSKANQSGQAAVSLLR